tara:strand:+ start:188 stop:481 length:294 start_codon:yes stop_codon:yes gene_type:complete
MCLKYQEVDKTSGDFTPTNAADRLAHTDNEYVNPGTDTSVPDWKRDRGETENEWRRRKRLEYDKRKEDYYAQWWERGHNPYGDYAGSSYPDYISGDG